MASVLIVDDSPTIRHALATAIRGMSLEPVLAESGEMALELFTASPPSIVLLDVIMPGIDGYETARRMRAALPHTWVPIIFLSSSIDDQNLERAIDSGGDDYLVKPASTVVLAAKIRALQRLDRMYQKTMELSAELARTNERLETLSQQDGLTGIANRRTFDHRLALQFSDVARRKAPLSVVICDVDHFKAYNDRYGHPAGDQCLRKIADVLARNCKRATDLYARYGGEEFALILPETPVEGALRVAEAIRAELVTLAIVHEASPTSGVVTLSAGVATYAADRDRDGQSLVVRADQALYRAKELGRNRVICS